LIFFNIYHISLPDFLVLAMTDNPPFITLTRPDGSIDEFKLEKHVGKRRKRIKYVLNYIKENSHNITPNTIRLLKLYAKMPVYNYNGRLNPYHIYMTLPGVYDRVDNFLNGIRGGVWPHLYTQSLLWAFIKSGLWVIKEHDFWHSVSMGFRRLSYGHVLDLRYVVSGIPDKSHDKQLIFMTIMDGISPFGSTGLDKAMITHIYAFMSSPEYIASVNSYIEKKNAKKASKKE
jgi:hypothetical protein